MPVFTENIKQHDLSKPTRCSAGGIFYYRPYHMEVFLPPCLYHRGGPPTRLWSITIILNELANTVHAWFRNILFIESFEVEWTSCSCHFALILSYVYIYTQTCIPVYMYTHTIHCIWIHRSLHNQPVLCLIHDEHQTTYDHSVMNLSSDTEENVTTEHLE